MRRVRRTLAGVSFFELTEDECAIYKECWSMTRGSFEVFAFRTNSLRAKGNDVIMQFPMPRCPPGQAVGWTGAIYPKKLFLPTQDYGQARYEIENAPIKVFRLSIVVEPKDARRALTAILKNALSTMRLGEMNASSAGLMI